MNTKTLCSWLVAMSLIVPKTVALDLIMTFDNSVPYLDPLGVDRTYELVRTIEAAKTIWEDIIEDERTLAITYGWDDLREGVLAVQGAKILFDTHAISGVAARTWFFDPTPLNHSEFDFSAGQHLAGDAETDPGWFSGNVPQQLEIGYVGRPIQDGRGFDLLTVALHEIGHWLGVDASGAYRINPDFVAGATVSIRADDGHLPLTGSLMRPTLGSARILPSAADVFAAASNSGWTRIDLSRKDFYGRGGDLQWTNSFNWAGNQVPGARDDAHLRHGGSVRLALPGEQQITDLDVADGSELIVEAQARLRVDVDPRVWDSEGNVHVRNGATIIVASGETSAPGLEAQSMRLTRGSLLSLAGGTVRIHGELSVDECPLNVACPSGGAPASTITGYGTIEIGDRLVSGGQIAGRAHPTNPTLRTLALRAGQTADFAWELSSVPRLGEPTTGAVVASQGDVRFVGGQAAHVDGHLLAENGYSIQFDAAELTSQGTLTVRNRMSFTFAPRFENHGSVELVSGGSLHTAQFFNSAGTVHGEGRLVFSDAFSNHAGVVLADQGQTLVLAATARSVDWDLAGGSTESIWRANEQGCIRFSATAAENITMEPFSGVMIVTDGSAIDFTFPRPFELPVNHAGRVDIVGSGSKFFAPQATLLLGVDEQTPSNGPSRLRIEDGRTELHALYVGGSAEQDMAEAIVELEAGEIIAHHGLKIGHTGRVHGTGSIHGDVVNSGLLHVGEATGTLSIRGTYLQGPNAILSMDITSLAMHDRLVVSGPATLDGTLMISFQTLPTVGDSFDMLNSPIVSGNFRNIVLPSQVSARFLPSTGSLEIIGIVPESSTVWLLLVGAIALWLSLASRTQRLGI